MTELWATDKSPNAKVILQNLPRSGASRLQRGAIRHSTLDRTSVLQKAQPSHRPAGECRPLRASSVLRRLAAAGTAASMACKYKAF